MKAVVNTIIKWTIQNAYDRFFPDLIKIISARKFHQQNKKIRTLN